MRPKPGDVIFSDKVLPIFTIGGATDQVYLGCTKRNSLRGPAVPQGIGGAFLFTVADLH